MHIGFRLGEIHNVFEINVMFLDTIEQVLCYTSGNI